MASHRPVAFEMIVQDGNPAGLVSDVLKLKTRGPDGLYCWKPRHFTLDPTAGTLCLRDISTPDGLVQSCQLKGARCEMAWSAVSELTNCGFDLVWNSGKTWSILATDAKQCRSWVASIREVIKEEAAGGGSPSRQRSPGRPEGASSGLLGLAAASEEVWENYQDLLHRNAASVDDDGSLSRHIVSFDDTTISTIQTGAGATGVALSNGNAPSDASSHKSKETSGQSSSGAECSLPPAAPSTTDQARAREVMRLEQRCDYLESALERAAKAAGEAEGRTLELQVQLEKSSAAEQSRASGEAAQELELLQRRHRAVTAKLRAECDEAVAKAQEEARDEYQDELVAARAAVSQELNRVKADAAVTQRQQSNALRDVQALLAESEERCEQLQREKQEAGAVNSRAGMSMRHEVTRLESQLRVLQDEKELLEQELDESVRKTAEEGRDLAQVLRRKHQQDLAEVSARYELEREALREQIRAEYDSTGKTEVATALAQAARRHAAELGSVRAELEAARESAVKKVKDQAARAKAETQSGVEELRSLQQQRVAHLEAMVQQQGDALVDAKRELTQLKMARAADAAETKRVAEEEKARSVAHMTELGRIRSAVKQAQAGEQAALTRERLAKDELRHLTDESRLEKAERDEVRRQLAEAVASERRGKSKLKKQARDLQQMEMQLDIAKEEVALLEVDQKRLEGEKAGLESTVNRLSRLVYGGRGLGKENYVKKATTSEGKKAKGLSLRG
ncbi:unnamed protein product [Chrysoparadoxa australica]